MKILWLSLALALSGCTTSSTKAKEYCDQNWEGRYNSWQDCYDRELPQQNKGAKAAGAILGGMGQGLQNASQNRRSTNTNCTSYVNGQMVQTNCNSN